MGNVKAIISTMVQVSTLHIQEMKDFLGKEHILWKLQKL
jgi:hypothetical protein